MNKIFKVIFNRATGKTVVVSELTKANGKSASQTDERARVGLLNISAVTTAAVLLGSMSVSLDSYAAIAEGAATGDRTIAIGTNSTAPTSQSVALGFQANASGAQSVALGADTKSVGVASIAIGGDDADGTSYQSWAYNATQGKVVNTGKDNKEYQSTTANGSASVAIGTKAQAMTEGSVSVGVLATAAGTEAVSLGAKSSSKGSRAIALGAGSTASGNQAFAAGDGSLATANSTIAIGSSANASSINATAVGVSAKAIGENATSLGMNASSEANTVAIGANAIVQNSAGVGGLALGKGANATGRGASALGTSAVANGTYASAYGDTTKVHAERAIAVGLASTINSGSTNATLLGSHATIGENSVRAVSVGSGNSVSSANATALGSGITIGTGLENSVVLGANSGTGGSHSIANETGATVNGVSYSGFAGTVNSTGNFVSVGTNATGGQRKIINVAAGNVSATSTEAINGSQLYMVANELKNQIGTGSSIRYFSVNSTNVNNRNNNGATAAEAVAIGPNATAAGTQSIAIGFNSTAANGTTNTIAIGRNANASADSGTAIGNAAHSTQDSAAYGVLANASALRTTAIGPVARALAGNATAVGNEAIANATFATAIGDKAIANVSNGVALGSGSVANRDVPTTSGYDVSTGAASTDTSTTWRANTAAVSVGNSTNTRQIINVAAGSEDTDAVNVAQLKKVTANAASATRAYNFTIANGEAALANTTGTADNWTLSSDDTLSFGATSNLSVTTDGAGKIVYDLSSTFTDKINNIETTANNANTTANAANATANDAKAVADTANATANDANTTAAEAKDAADAANATANTANTTANNAKTAADTALITADKANATANAANTTANAANATANDANATANAANATANDANATANAANATANDANATANTANATANDANATANTANATANDANATANTANNTANTAQAGVDTLNARKYTFNVKNDADAQATNDGQAQEWQLNADNNVTFGATSFLNVTTDAAGNIIYDLSESSKTALNAAGTGADGKDGSNGTDGASVTGPTGADGLNGKDLTTKVNALRNGEAGPVVYTDADGNRLVKANDGKYYPADQVGENGEPATGATAVDSPIASVVNPDGSTTSPTTMGNVKSNIGPNNGEGPISADDAKTAVTDLLDNTTGLNNVATVGDLQAIAQAGLDFTGNNNGTTVHRPLGSKLTVEGEGSTEAEWADKSTAANNLYVEADSANNKLVVKMASDLANLTSVAVGDDANGVKITPNGTTTTATAADGTSVVSDLTANGTTIVEKDAAGNPTGKEAAYTLDGAKVADGTGNVTTTTPEGVTVKDADGKEATYGADGIGLKGADGNTTTIGTDDNGNLTVTNGKDGADAKPQTLVTSDNIASMKGTDGKDGKDGTDATSAGAQGLTGKDGLNGASLDDKINALRNGEAGPVVYTDEDGNRLVKANDGKYYPAYQVDANGNPATDATAVDSPIASVVNPDGSTTSPTTMGNVKSNIGPNNGDAAIDATNATTAVADLLNSTTGFNNVATLGDLQAIAQAGLDFTGNNNGTTVHRPLSSKLTVEGEGAWDGQNSAADNLYVEADATNNKLVVKMNENLTGINSVDFKPTEITNPDGTTTYAKASISSAGNNYTETDKDGKAVPNGKTASYGLNGSELADGTGNVTTTTAAGTNVKDPEGNTANYTANGSTVTDKEGNTANYTANGSTVTDKDGNTANYTANGSTVTDKEGNTANYTANGSTVTDKEGNTANYTANGSTVTDKEGNTANYTANGSTVTDKDGNTANYTANGSTVTDKDGNTANYTANGSTVTDKEGNTANYTANGTTITDKDGNTTNVTAGTITVSNGNDTTTIGAGEITGLKDLADNADGSSAVNKNYVDSKLGETQAVVGTGADGKDGSNGTDGASITGPAGKDGLNGKDLTTKVNALRNGEAGPVVYTDADGNRLVKANDGSYYPADQVNEDGSVKDGATAVANPIASLVNTDGTTTNPTTMGNVKSNIGPNNGDAAITAENATTAVSGLLNSTSGFNNVATVGDLQAIAQAGLDFTGNNSDTTVHRPLSSKLAIEGEGTWNGQNSAADNLYVQADAANNKLVVKMNENLTGINSVDFKPTEITNPDGSKTYAKSTISSAGNTYVETDKDGNAVANGKSATYGLNGSTLADGKGNVTNMTAAGTNVVDAAGNSANYGANGSTVADAAGNTANYGANGSTVTDVAGNTANYGANGSIVTDVAGNTANYGANGLTVADKDGNPAITLVNNASGPSLNFATDANGNGTGKITGVAAGDITPNSSDVVTGAQLYQLTGGNTIVNNANGTTTSTAKGLDGKTIMTTDENGNQVEKQYTLTTYNVEGQTEFVTNSVITAVHNMNEQGIKFFHTNDGVAEPINQASNSIDSSASGSYATAVGYQAKADGTNAIAMGKGATAAGENSIAIGTGNQVLADKSGAFGDDNVITSSNTFVLGNDVNNSGNVNGKPVKMGDTVENSVYLGNKSTATAGDGSRTGTLKNLKQDGTKGSTTTAGSTGTVSSAKVGNMTYGGFAGAKADGVVSVGAAGNERRVQNVAAGEISATSTDAINGSQLYSVAKGVDQLDGKVNRMNRKLRSGIAAATAMTNIPQVTMPGKSALGAGVGSYDGQGALAVGYSRMSDSGRVIFKVSAGATTQGKYNAGAGVALQW